MTKPTGTPGISVTLFIAIVIGTAACAPAAAPPGAPKAENKWPPAGASYVMAERNSGSYGSGTRQQTIKYLGEQTWQAKKVIAFSDGSVTSYVDAQRRLLGRVQDGSPVESFEPHFLTADWPIFVGKWWLNRYRYNDHQRGRSFDNVQFDGKVEALEDVKTSAGTFKAFKIAFSNPFNQLVVWYSPDLGLFIKTRAERFANHYLGTGMRETELVSYDFRP